MPQSMILPVKYLFDHDNNPLAFGKVYTYEAGTTTPKDTYDGEEGAVNPNPVILNGEGYGRIYLDGSYNIVVDDQNDVNIWSEDPVSSNAIQEWTNCSTATYISPSSFSLVGDKTEQYTPGRVVRIDNAAADYSYSTIQSSVFATGNTSVSLGSAVVSVNIIGVCASIIGQNSIPGNVPKKIDNIQALRALSVLNVDANEVVFLSGYYTPGGGGHGPFFWNITSTAVDDGGSIILPTGHVGPGRFQRIFGDAISLLEFGASLALADNAIAVQNAVTYAKSIDLLDVVGSTEGGFALGSTVLVPVGVKISDASFLSKLGSLYYDATGTLVAGNAGGYLFFMNVDPAAPATWIEQFPNMRSGGVESVFIDGAPSSGINGFYFAGSHYFRDIQCSNVGTLIRKPNVYTDAVEIHRIHSQDDRINTTDYLIYLDGLGDGYDISYIASGQAISGVPTRNLYVALCRGGSIRNLINGVCYFDGTGPGVTVSAGHFESGGIILDSCDMDVNSNLFFTEDDNLSQIYGITVNNIRGTATDISRHVNTIRSNYFYRMPNNRGGWPTVDKPDINFADLESAAILTGNIRGISVSGVVSTQQKMVALVGFAGSVLTDWENYAHLLVKNDSFVEGNKVLYSGSGPQIKSFNGWNNAAAVMRNFSANNWTFSGATDTYYYAIQMISDPVRLIGRTGTVIAEATAAAVNGGDIVTLQAEKGANEYHAHRVYRIYKGTATGIYDEFVDIPALSCWRFFDDGIGVNGFPWLSRSAGAVDTLNLPAYAGQFSMDENVIDLKIASGSANPTVGTWKQGDKLEKVDITVPSIGSTTLTGMRRLVTGSAHVDGTDWMRIADERI